MFALNAVVWLTVSLGIYEFFRGIVSLAKGKGLKVAAKDFVAAGFIGAVAVILYALYLSKRSPQ